jgi:hypothetical protein
MRKKVIYRIKLVEHSFYIMIFILIGINVMQNLSIHAENQSSHMNIIDFFSLLFINTQNPSVDYIDFRNPTTLLGIVTILFIGAIYTSNHFIKFNKQYLYMTLIRYGNVKRYICDMTRRSLKRSLTFTFLLYAFLLVTITTMNKSIFTLHSSYSSYSIVTSSIIFLNYYLIFLLFIFTISRLMIYVNLIKGSVLSILVGLTVPILILMADIKQTSLNVILFDYAFFFLDSVSVAFILNVLISILGKILIKKYKLF